MELGALFLILAVVILVGVFVSRPFFERESQTGANLEAASPQEHLRSTLMAARDQALTALQELDFDHSLGKIPEEEYPAQRATLLRHGADVLRQLDELAAQNPPESAETRLEMAVAARRADGELVRRPVPSAAVAAEATLDDEIERRVSERRQARLEPAAGFCPKCGRPIQKSDQFCTKCGTRL